MPDTSLPRPLVALVAAGARTVQRSQAPRLGIATCDLTRWKRLGYLEGVGHGGYVILAPAHVVERPWEESRRRHLLRAQAVTGGLPGSYVVGLTAALSYDLRPLEQPNEVYIARRPGFRSRRPIVVARQAWGGGAEERSMDDVGLPRELVAEAVVEVAATHGVRSGLVVANRALATRRCTHAELVEAGLAYGVRKGSVDVRAMLAHADARIDRAIETVMYWICCSAAIKVTPQVVIRDAHGGWVAQVDFLVDGTRVVVETDGLEKYSSPSDLRKEKHRELDIQAAGYTVVRFSWRDVQNPAAVVARIHQAVRSSPGRPMPVAA